MEENKLAARIRPLESFAAANPRLYRFRVALLASLGYIYLLVIGWIYRVRQMWVQISYTRASGTQLCVVSIRTILAW